MSIGDWNEQALRTFVLNLLDNQGLSRPDSGLADQSVVTQKIKDGTIVVGDLSTAAQNAFLKLLSAANLSIAFGTGSVTFTASTVSANTTFSHGLGGTPVWVGIEGTDLNTVMWGHNKSSTQLTVRGSYASAISGTFGFEWAAIG